MINAGQPQNWSTDTRASVDMYNTWFMNFAPLTFRESRKRATSSVEKAFHDTDFLKDITPESLRANPSMLPSLRMSTCPPLAIDRLIGLSGVPSNVVDRIENKGIVSRATTTAHLQSLIAIIDKLLDRDIFPWLQTSVVPAPEDAHRAATIVADRLCGSYTNPIIRNAQELRQLAYIEQWLIARGYTKVAQHLGLTIHNMQPGTFAFRMVVPGKRPDGSRVNIPVDAIIQPLTAKPGELPLLVEAKSAGDFANTNKRRKEETTKVSQLIHENGPGIRFVLFLCGYFDGSYLGHNASELIDWVWEHRIDDFTRMGI